MLHTAEMISVVCSTLRRFPEIFSLSFFKSFLSVFKFFIFIFSSCLCGDDLRGVHHAAETNCTLRRLPLHLYLSLVAFKGTVRSKPFRGELIYCMMEEKISRKNFDLLRNFFDFRTLWRSLCDRIFRLNQNRIRKYFSMFIRGGPDGLES